MGMVVADGPAVARLPAHREKTMTGRPKTPRYNSIDSRGCPGSYLKIKHPNMGKVVCPFCFREKRVNKNGTLGAHQR